MITIVITKKIVRILSISLLNEFDEPKLVKKFIWDLADRNNVSTSVNSVKTANDIGRHDFAVQAGKFYTIIIQFLIL